MARNPKSETNALGDGLRSATNFLAFSGCLATPAVGQMTLTKIYEFTDHDSPLQNCGLVESPDGRLDGWSGRAGADRRSLLFRIRLTVFPRCN
jgi:hypothetical protein